MAKALRISLLTSVLLLSASFTPVWAAADDFGARFTHQAPLALGVSESDALLATQDADFENFSPEDLNAIAPAAGGDVAGSVSVGGNDDVQKEDTPENSVPTDKPVE